MHRSLKRGNVQEFFGPRNVSFALDMEHGTCRDTSPNRYPVTVQSGAVSAGGLFRGSMYFPGTGYYTSAVTLAGNHPPFRDLVSPRAYMMWIRPIQWTVSNGEARLVSGDNTSFGTVSIRLDSAGRLGVWTSGNNDLVSNAVIPLDAWTHICCTMVPGSTKAIYLNGRLDSIGVMAPLVAGALQYYTIANYNYISPTIPYHGYLSNLAFLTRALTAGEIAAYYRWATGFAERRAWKCSEISSGFPVLRRLVRVRRAA